MKVAGGHVISNRGESPAPRLLMTALPFFTFMVINKVNLIFIQKSGFIEDIEQNKSVQIFLPPLSGHGDCATDHL